MGGCLGCVEIRQGCLILLQYPGAPALGVDQASAPELTLAAARMMKQCSQHPRQRGATSARMPVRGSENLCWPQLAHRGGRAATGCRRRPETT